MRALIVDDSRFMRQYLRQVLECSGLLCEEAADGREALQILRRPAAFDFMLVDINMPQMNGLDCVKALRDTGLHAPMKVLMVTSEASSALICRALESGADEFLMKPFTPELLQEKLAMLGLEAR